MKLVKKTVNCLYDSSITQSVVNDNQENDGFLAVSVVPGGTTDNNTGLPVPRVKLATTAAEQIYGVLATFNGATQRCGVITSGIVPVRKNAATVGGDISRGIIADNTAAGQVTVSTGSPNPGTGRGTVVGRTGNVLWVDLDAGNNAIA